MRRFPMSQSSRPLSSIASVLVCLSLSGCVSAPLPPAMAPVDHARFVASGFEEALPGLSERLNEVAAYAVFADVEDSGRAFEHEGWLFPEGAAPSPIGLGSNRPPSAPAGDSFHLLVLFGTEASIPQVGEADVDLASARHVDLRGDLDGIPRGEALVVITSAQGGLLFDSQAGRHRLVAR
ncbi:MAG: hypothetical protein ACYTFV_16695 [Planctomycetota bacterium]